MEVANLMSPNLSATPDKKATPVNEGDFTEQLMKYAVLPVTEGSKQLESETNSSQENNLTTEELELVQLQYETEEESDVFALINPFISLDVQTDYKPVDLASIELNEEISKDSHSNNSQSALLVEVSESSQEVTKVNSVPIPIEAAKKQIDNQSDQTIDWKQAVELDSSDVSIGNQLDVKKPSVETLIEGEAYSKLVQTEESKHTERVHKPIDIKEVDSPTGKGLNASQPTETAPTIELYTYQRNLSQVITRPSQLEQAGEVLTSPLSVKEEEVLSELPSMVSIETQVTTPKVTVTAPSDSQPMVTLEESMDQIEELFVQRVQNDKGTEVIQSTIRLTPESLGDIEIELIFDKDDVSGKFIFKSEEAKRYVESQLNQLRNPLEAKGIKFNSIEMTVKEQPHTQSQDMTFSQSFNQSKGEKQAASQPSLMSHEEGIEADPEPLLEKKYSRESGLNVYA